MSNILISVDQVYQIIDTINDELRETKRQGIDLGDIYLHGMDVAISRIRSDVAYLESEVLNNYYQDLQEV